MLAKEWAAEQPWASNTRAKNERVLRYLNAEIGSRPVTKITTPVAHEVLKKIAQRGPDVGQMAYQAMNAVMFDALTLGMIDRNPVTIRTRRKTPSTRFQCAA